MRLTSPKRLGRALVLLALVAAVAVPAALAFGFTDGNHPPDGVVGTPYSYQFSVDGGCKPYVFVVQNGSLPAGLAFDSSHPGLLTGTPTAAGSSFFWVEVRDTGCTGTPGNTCPPNGISCTIPSQRPFTIYIAPKLTVTTDALAPALVGVPYTVKLAAAGGGSQKWSLLNGSLPTGLTLAADGTISGTPTAATPDPASFTVKVTDDARTDTKALTLDVVTPLAVTQPTLPAAEVGRPLTSVALTATGGRAPYTWALTAAPAGITIDPASGTVRGTPSAAGGFPLQVSVTDKYGASATVTGTLVVRAKVVVRTAKLLPTRIGKLYRATLRTSGGIGPFVWKITAGTLPTGIHLNRSTGLLSGAARKAGTFRLTFTVTDRLGGTAKTTLTLKVAPPPKKT